YFGGAFIRHRHRLGGRSAHGGVEIVAALGHERDRSAKRGRFGIGDGADVVADCHQARLSTTRPWPVGAGADRASSATMFTSCISISWFFLSIAIDAACCVPAARIAIN